MIYIVKIQSFLRTPLISLAVEGEDWIVGFDGIFEEMPEHSIIDFDGITGYPASRIVAHHLDGFELQLDLKAFRGINPNVTVEDGFLTITATKNEPALDQNQNYLQRGISARGFRRSFQLNKNLHVVGTGFLHDLLRIEIENDNPNTPVNAKTFEQTMVVNA